MSPPRVIAQMVYFTVVVGFIMVMGLVILLSYIMHPLRQLRLGFLAVARGDLDYRVPVQSKDEVGQIVQLFNATINRLRLAFHEIEQLARRDPLTGLPNRRAFDERLSAEAARSRRYGHPFGVIILDLDLFKSVNDRYGHPAGDEVLKFVGKTVDANIRETDHAARIGGEEFAVILPESGIEDVRAVAEKLREAVGEGLIQAANAPDGIRITLSAGAACSAGHLVTPESIVAAADAALFRSKNEGRNRVSIAPPIAGKTRVLMRTQAAPPDASDPHKGVGSEEGLLSDGFDRVSPSRTDHRRFVGDWRGRRARLREGRLRPGALRAARGETFCARRRTAQPVSNRADRAGRLRREFGRLGCRSIRHALENSSAASMCS